MPSRNLPLVSGQIYHIYNRGVEKRSIFENRRDYKRFIETINYYQLDGPKPKLSHFSKTNLFKPNPSKKIIEILSYCLMPNHFHLLIRQLNDAGISKFLSQLSNSYTKYYNTKHNRTGHLFQGQFKAVLVEDDEQLTHLSRYIHLNPFTSFLTKDLRYYEWSSFLEFINNKNSICSKYEILSLFKSPQQYEQFVLDQAEYAQQLHLLKSKLIDQELA